MNIVPLKPPKPCDDVISSLRRLADEIESGGIDWPVTTCVVVLGHTGSETNPDENRNIYQQVCWQTRGYGARVDNFTVRGLLATVLYKDWDND